MLYFKLKSTVTTDKVPQISITHNSSILPPEISLLPSQFHKKRDKNPKHNKEESSASKELKTAVKIVTTLRTLKVPG